VVMFFCAPARQSCQRENRKWPRVDPAKREEPWDSLGMGSAARRLLPPHVFCGSGRARS
jgi:hypothetical protein